MVDGLNLSFRARRARSERCAGFLSMTARAPSTSQLEGSMRQQMTAREREVLSLLCEGMSNKSIARQLGIARGTVKVHVTKILKALSVETRTQAVIATLRARIPAG